MNIFDTIRKTQANIGLNSSEKSNQDKLKNEVRNNGIVTLNAYAIQRKELRELTTDMGAQVTPLQGTISNNDYLSNVKYYSNIPSNIKVPYLKSEDVKWGYINPTEASINCSGLILKPKRVSTYIDISTSVDITNNNLNDEVANLLNNAIYDKVIESIFSDGEETTDSPKGLFNGVSANAITEDNILNAVEEVTKSKNNGFFVISPSAYTKLYKEHKDLFNNDKLVGFNYVVDGRCQDGYMAFIDVTKIAFADWTINSITIDNVTKMSDGYIRVLVESFVDFGLLDNEAIKCLTISDEEEEEEQEQQEEEQEEPNE